MTLDDFLPRLDGVRRRGPRYMARCPAHGDKSPSLQVTEGEKGILLKCWAGCTLTEICEALGLEQECLFFDALDTNPQRRKAAAQERERRQREHAEEARRRGRRIDARREADSFIQSRRGLDISGWSDQRLDNELNMLADAYTLLESEGLDG